MSVPCFLLKASICAFVTAADATGNGWMGTLFNFETGTDWIAGADGGALDFDGINEYVERPLSSKFRI